MMSAWPAPSGRRPQPAGDIIRAVCGGTFPLHALPVHDCPSTRPLRAAWRKVAPDDEPRRARRNISPTATAGCPGGHLRSADADQARGEDLVLVHGDATFEQILIGPTKNIGFIDCGMRVRATATSISPPSPEAIADHFGPEWVETFARAYGDIRLDAAKLAFFSDLMSCSDERP